MNFDTTILGYVIDCFVVCTKCANEHYIEEIKTPEAHVVNQYNSTEWSPTGCSCDVCHEYVVEPTEEEEELDIFTQFVEDLEEGRGTPKVFSQFLNGLK